MAENPVVTESPLTTAALSSQTGQKSIFKQKVLPKLNSIISTSSGLVSNLIGFAGGFLNKKPVEAEETVRSSSYSSSIMFDDSPDILILSKQKVYGRRERFSQEFAINLKKLRNGRFSEYTPNRNLTLHMDSDVQPQIVSLRESNIEQRKRTESCYPRLQHHKSDPDLASVSIRKENEEAPPLDQASGRGSDTNPLILLTSEEHRVENEESGLNVYKTHESGSEDDPQPSSSCEEDVYVDPKPQVMSRCISIESASVSLNGKIFKYFDKAQLCSVPVVNFEEFCEKLKGLQLSVPNAWQDSFFNKLCRCTSIQLEDSEEEELEKVIYLSLTEFEPDNDLHLMLLLGTYILVTGESDWPSCEKDWLKLGFSSVDIRVELIKGGVLGLMFLFFLADNFRSFLREIIKVSIYYSFEAFQVIKQFITDAVRILRAKKLHGCMNEKGKSVEQFFLFACGMLKKWFKLIVSNKDFKEMHKTVIAQGKSTPQEFILIAQNMDM